MIEHVLSEGQVVAEPAIASICHAYLRCYTGQRRPEALARKLSQYFRNCEKNGMPTNTDTDAPRSEGFGAFCKIIFPSRLNMLLNTVIGKKQYWIFNGTPTELTSTKKLGKKKTV